jgi:hypothetical protein
MTAHILGLIGTEHTVSAMLGPAAQVILRVYHEIRTDPASFELQPTPVGVAIICQATKAPANG